MTKANGVFTIGLSINALREPMNALDRAIEIAGGTSALARRLGVHSNVVTNWKKRGVPIPECPEVEKATGGQVRCEELNNEVDWAYLRSTIDICSNRNR